ncbi:MAG: hypothetical protein DRO93_10325, partial [Candidatus Thorarchaeota archaeon]
MLIMALLVLSVAAAVGMASAQSEEPYIRVQWHEADEIHPFEHTDENSQWIFGSQPSILVTYAENGTNIADHDYHVDVGVELYINITIPVSFLGEGNDLGSVLFWGSGHLPRSPLFVLQYNATADAWNKLSFAYQPGKEKPTPSDFLELNRTACSYTETSEGYIIVFTVTFVQDVGPRIFWTGMQATDTEGKPVSLSWLARIQRGDFESPPLALGVKVDKEKFGFPEYYYAEVTDLNGELLHYVGVDDPFVFDIRANEPLGRVEVPFSILTFEEDYLINNPVQVPENLEDHDTTWKMLNLSMPYLSFVYNSSGAYALAGYISNVHWTWSVEYHVWVISFSMTYDYSIDVGLFYNLTEIRVFNGGAEVAWVGSYTNRTDMNPDPYDVGTTITPDPFFWRVENTGGDKLQPRPEITLHNTVRLAFMAQFVHGAVMMNGEVAHHAMQGDTVNLTLDFFGDPGKINGSFYIFINKTDAFRTEQGYQVDLNGYLVHVIRDNITLWIEGSGSGQNETMFWHVSVTHSITIDFQHNVTYSNSTVTITYLDSDRNYVGTETTESSSMITVIDSGLELGNPKSTLWVTVRFETDAPSMKVDTAYLTTGYRAFGQANLTLPLLNITTWFPSEVNWSQAISYVDTIDEDNILWVPRQFVLGTVRFWEAPKWTVTEDGAIDLDGNVFTTDDQYFVKRTGTWRDWGNVTVQGMTVGVMFEPSPGVLGDEFHSWSWMGVLKLVIEFEAAENFYWYHADDFTPVNATEMAEIRARLWANETTEIPQPGYEWVAWLSKNRTIDLTEITGLEDNVWETTWFAWGTQQWFKVSTNATSMTWASFRAKYAGLLLFKDSPEGTSPSAPDFAIEDGKVVTDEVTHVVLIDDVGSVELRKPFGATNSSGDVKVSPDTEVSFGITIRDVNVTLFPLQVANADGIRGPWDLRQSYEGSLGLDPTDFNHWISHAQVTEMSFDITFNVDMVQYNPDDPTTWNHAVSFKVDQQFGNWTLDEFNNTVLEDYGLAVNFFGILGTATRTTYRAGEQPIADTNSNSLSASYYQFGAEDSPFANVTMGGLPYTWGGDNFTHTYISGSSTAPIGAFSLIYESQSGETITDWNVEASMLFMTAGYDHWGGHEIRCDPVFVSYTSAYYGAGETTTTTTTSTTTST